MSGVFLSTPSVRAIACVAMDVLLLAGTLWLAVAIRFANPLPSYEDGLLKGVVFVAVMILAFYYNELYGGRVPRGGSDLLLRVLQAFVAGAVILALLYLAFPRLALGRGILLIQPFLALFLILSWRAAYYWAIQREGLTENVLILGTGSTAVDLAREVLGHRKEGFRVVGFVSQEAEEVGKCLLNPMVVGTFEQLPWLSEQLNVHSLVVALDDQRGKLPVRELLACKLRGIRVAQGPEFYERLTGQLPVRGLRPSHIIFSPGFRKPRFLATTRRFVESSLALVGLVTSLPILLGAAILVWLDDGLPIFFRQERVGQYGRLFELYKLRTMRRDAEKNGAVWASPAGDPRITRIGHFLRKSRIDEIPQLFNVLRGDMSFVGPRPERPVFVEQLRAEIPYYDERHTVRPGITGWAQVRNGYSSSIEESEAKLRFDLFYIKNQSVWLDLQIILDTVKVIVFGRGAR